MTIKVLRAGKIYEKLKILNSLYFRERRSEMRMTQIVMIFGATLGHRFYQPCFISNTKLCSEDGIYRSGSHRNLRWTSEEFKSQVGQMMHQQLV